MKKLLILIAPLFFSFLISLFSLPVIAATCVPDRQSCDQNNICCNFPNTLCRGGYCEPPPNPTCGRQNTPCCDSPNPRCVSGLVCSGEYCSAPTPTPTPPTCGVYQYQPCCPSEPKCFGALECRNNICYPKAVRLSPPPTTPGQSSQPKYCDPPANTQIETGLGCIPTKETTNFIAWILKFAIGIGGGIAFILMLIGVFQIITSSGDPERLKAGKELITSALIGLLMIIFSLFLLQLIGVQILQIPGF